MEGARVAIPSEAADYFVRERSEGRDRAPNPSTVVLALQSFDQPGRARGRGRGRGREKAKGVIAHPPKRTTRDATSSSWSSSEPPSWSPSWSSPLDHPSRSLRERETGGVNGPPPLIPGALTSSSSRPSLPPS